MEKTVPKRKRPVTCSVFGCVNRKKPSSRFPRPEKNLDTFRRWVEASNNPSFASLTVEQIRKRGYICASHFTSDDYLPDHGRLRPGAIPSQNLPSKRKKLVHPMNLKYVASDSVVVQADAQPGALGISVLAEEVEAEEEVTIDLPPPDPSTVTVDIQFETFENEFSPFIFPVPYTFQDSYRGVQHEEPMISNVESAEEYNDLCNSCRICLTIKENMVLLDSPLCEEKDDEKSTEITILEALEKLMSQKLFMHEKWPSAICETCRQLLKQAYDLNILFHQSQDSLSEVFKDHLPKDQHTSDSTCMSENIESVCKSDDKDKGIGEEQHVHCEAEKKENCYEKKTGEIDEVVSNKEITLGINNDGRILSTIEIKKKEKKPKKVFRCDMCNLICARKPRLIKHMAICRMRPKLRTCRSCGATVSLVGDGNDVLCDSCGSVGTLGATSKSKKYQDFLCYICGHIFSGGYGAVHMLTHREARFECKICNKKFRHKMRLKVHLDLHKNIRNYLCNICGQTLADSSGLTCHMKRKHSKERNFVCEICNKKFYLRADLTQHLKIHNTTKPPYTCSFCDRVCLTSGGARLHEVIHTGERPFKCRFCGKTFVFKPHLKAHEMTHSGPCECDYCDKAFIAVDLLNLHVKQKHKNVDVVS